MACFCVRRWLLGHVSLLDAISCDAHALPSPAPEAGRGPLSEVIQLVLAAADQSLGGGFFVFLFSPPNPPFLYFPFAGVFLFSRGGEQGMT